jgi:hypothetical protein
MSHQASVTTHRDSAVAALRSLIACIPRRPDVWVRASENSDHVGAVLADAALQPGVDYKSVVEPRVKRFVHDFPVAITVSGVRALLETCDASTLLGNRNARKCGVFRSLVDLLGKEGVETISDLRAWLDRPGTKAQLLAIHGVKHKTAAYLRLLVGLPAIAIDVHLRRLASEVGVEGSDEELETFYTVAAEAEGVSLRDLDGSLWQAGTDSSRRRAT